MRMNPALRAPLLSLALIGMSAMARAQIASDEGSELASGTLADLVAEHSLLAVGVVVLAVFAAGAIGYTIGRSAKD